MTLSLIKLLIHTDYASGLIQARQFLFKTKSNLSEFILSFSRGMELNRLKKKTIQA